MSGMGKRASVIRLSAIAAAIGVIAAVACTKVGTEPSVAVAIESFAPPLPSVVVGDTMRDTSGNIAPLRATVYNSSGEPIPDAPIHFLALDSLHRITLDTSTGIVVGRDTGRTRVVAHVGNLQSQPIMLTVVLQPTAIIPADSLVDTLHYTIDFTTGRCRTCASGSCTWPVPIRSLCRATSCATASCTRRGTTTLTPRRCSWWTELRGIHRSSSPPAQTDTPIRRCASLHSPPPTPIRWWWQLGRLSQAGRPLRGTLHHTGAAAVAVAPHLVGGSDVR